MNKLFIDTSAWITLINQSEASHNEARLIYEKKIREFRQVTSNLVIGETYTWLRRKVGYTQAAAYLESMERMSDLHQIEIIYADPDLETEAKKLLRKFSDQLLSYADAVSFAIMKKYNIKTGFAYDRHFLTTGFELINSI